MSTAAWPSASRARSTGEVLPSLFEAREVAEAILALDPASNGELAHRAFEAEEHKTGLPLTDLAEGLRDVRYTFADIVGPAAPGADHPHLVGGRSTRAGPIRPSR